MGVAGAAVATVIGQCVAGIVAALCNHKYNHEIKLSFKGFRPNIKIIGTIYAIAVPSIIMQSIGSIMTYSMNRILIAFSSTATAVFGVYFKLQSFFFMPVFGLNNGITPIIAYNYGAGQRKAEYGRGILPDIFRFPMLRRNPAGASWHVQCLRRYARHRCSCTSNHWLPLSDCLVLYYLRYGISGTWKSSIQYGGIHHASAFCFGSCCLHFGQTWRASLRMVGLPDCRNYLPRIFTYFLNADLSNHHIKNTGRE